MTERRKDLVRGGKGRARETTVEKVDSLSKSRKCRVKIIIVEFVRK